MEVLAYKPVGYWMLDTASPFPDLSGYDVSATRAGTEVKGIGLVSNAAYSQILNSNTITYPSLAYRAGKEQEPFTMMATILPIDNGVEGVHRILSNADLDDGLTIDGTVVSFSTEYLSSGQAKCSYDLRSRQRVTLVGVHSKSKNSLYANGVLVDEVDISPEQQADTYASTNNNLYSQTSPSGRLMINAVGIFTKNLTADNISEIQKTLNRRYDESVVRSMGGEELLVSTTMRTPFLNITFDTDEDWFAGTGRNVSSQDSTLIPNKIGNATIGGTWDCSFDIYNTGEPLSIDSINLQWVGENVTVQTSVNGSTWVTAESGVNLSNIPAGFVPTNKQLEVRITFDEGVENAFIDGLVINGYNANNAVPVAGRTVTFTNAVNFDEHSPMELRENWGVKLTGGTVSWGESTAQGAEPVRSIEFWLKKNSTSAPTLSFSPTVTYVNGISGGSSSRGEWALYHYVLPSGVSTFSIGGNITVGRAAIYTTALDADDALSIYSNYTGSESIEVDLDGELGIAESQHPVLVYANDWSISSA